MKINSVFAIVALASLMAAPLSVSAQGRDRDSRADHGSDNRGRSHNGDRGQKDSNRGSDRRSSENQNRGSNRDNQWRRNDNNRDWQPTRDSSYGRPTTSNERDWNRDRDRDRNRDRDRDWDRDRDRDRDRNWDRDRDRDRGRDWDRGTVVFRSSNHNEWRDIALAFGVVGLIGVLDHDDFLTFSGSAGALYAIWRYDEDSHCSDSYRRARAHYFSLPYFYRDGCRYERRTIERDGERYYQFVRCD